MRTIKGTRYFFLLAVMLGFPLTGSAATAPYDVVVYGATPSGIMTAVAASRHGMHVALVVPGKYVGGMMTGGLSFTDKGNIATIGGIPREFFHRVGHHYGEDATWGFEPHVAEAVYQAMLAEAKVDVMTGMRLREKGGVTVKDHRIIAITIESGKRIAAKEFADATYEGDLMAQAGVTVTWGRESRAEYGESLAGVLPSQRPDLQFHANVSPYGADGKLLPLVANTRLAAYGSGDKNIPSYNYRFCVTTDKANQLPFPKPAGYDASRFDLMARYLQVMEQSGKPLGIHSVFLLEKLKNNKWDANNMGAISTDFTGMNWTYPYASYKDRDAMALAHKLYDQSFFYFMANDPRIPKALQAEVNEYGLAKDEFTDTDGFPHQLYIREARRMIGAYMFTQHDVQERSTQPDSIGMGSYQLDSHNTQRVPTADGFVVNEGDYFVGVKPYEIPYRALTPKRAEITNLLVPVCISSTHAAYGTIRQEPVYMILGEATGTALAIAAKDHVAVQDVSIKELQKTLLDDKAVLHYSAK